MTQPKISVIINFTHKSMWRAELAAYVCMYANCTIFPYKGPTLSNSYLNKKDTLKSECSECSEWVQWVQWVSTVSAVSEYSEWVSE